MSPRRVDALLFDLDGTLIDSKRDIAASVNWTLAQLDLPPKTVEEVAGFVGDGVAKLLERALQLTDAARIQQAVQLFRGHYRQHCLDTTTLYPRVREVLEHFRRKALAVVTNKPLDVSVLIIRGLGIAPYFQAVVGGEAGARKKPHPDPLHKALAVLRVEPARAVMIGDGANDIVAGQAAGLVTCAVTYGLNHPDTLHQAQPDLVIDSLEELTRYVC